MIRASFIEGVRIEFIPGAQGQRVIVNGADWTRRVREADVNAAVSHVAAHPAVRERMVKLQRAMGTYGRVVMEGRDIGTHVFPGAAFKFFLVAGDRTRAGRRHAELADAGMAADEGAVLHNIRERDRIDSSRAAAPLRRAPDAVEIDTSNMNVDEVLQRMLAFMVSGGACPA
ncbi:MAG: (d)CMP kinase [Nitrospinae bacterium]|nr:(d)CMP kinase [Nitrospinota bacterium]